MAIMLLRRYSTAFFCCCGVCFTLWICDRAVWCQALQYGDDRARVLIMSALLARFEEETTMTYGPGDIRVSPLCLCLFA